LKEVFKKKNRAKLNVDSLSCVFVGVCLEVRVANIIRSCFKRAKYLLTLSCYCLQ